MGSAGGYHRQTLFDLLHDSTRDTWSYYLPNNTSYISNMALDRSLPAMESEAKAGRPQ